MAQNRAETCLVSAHVGRDLASRFARLARNHDRSVSAELRLAIRERLERAERERVTA